MLKEAVAVSFDCGGLDRWLTAIAIFGRTNLQSFVESFNSKLR